MCSKTYKSHLKQSPRLCHYLTSAHPINPFMRRSMKSNQVAWPGQSISKPSSRLPKQIKTTTERRVSLTVDEIKHNIYTKVIYI